MKFTKPNLIKPFEHSLIQLFSNKYFLYFILFLSTVVNLGYLVTNNLNAVGFFIAVAIITMQFSKNMAIVLAVCLVATKVLFANKTREGMEAKSKDIKDNDKKNNDKKDKKNNDKKDKKENDKTDKKDKGKTDKDKLQYRTPNEHTIVTPSYSDTTPLDDDHEETTDEASGFKPMHSEYGSEYGSNNKLDYGASITKAYSDLNNFLDPEGIKNLTKDTSELMNQQNQLYSSMNSMTPLLTQAKSLLSEFDMGKLKGSASM